MNRLHWCFVFGAVAAASLLCQSAARADDLLDASYTPVVSGGTSAQGTCPQNTCVPWEEGGCCGHLYASAEALFLAPVGNQQCVSYDVSGPRGNSLGYFDTGCVENGGLIATPRITLGYQGECWGFDVRYWRMQEPTEVTNLDAVNWSGADQQACFRAETLDLEATRLFCWGETQMQWAIGLRYGDANYAGLVNARNAFGGMGLTTALTGVRPIGCSNFSLFYSARASLLWDSCATTSVQALAMYEGDDGWANAVNGASVGTKGNLFIGEIEVGGQWNYALKCIPANAFIRAAFEYQYWGVTSDSCVAAFSAAGSLDGTLGTATAIAGGDAHTSLVGFSVGAGITY
jgi:hypothetical protein